MILILHFQNEGVYSCILILLDQIRFNNFKNKIANKKLEKGIDAHRTCSDWEARGADEDEEEITKITK
jgi:hypothetical protein